MLTIVNKVLHSYYKPTPRFWRKLGDALLGVSTFITGLAITEDHRELAIISLIIGSVGKFITNFFKEDDRNHHRRDDYEDFNDSEDSNDYEKYNPRYNNRDFR